METNNQSHVNLTLRQRIKKLGFQLIVTLLELVYQITVRCGRRELRKERWEKWKKFVSLFKENGGSNDHFEKEEGQSQQEESK